MSKELLRYRIVHRTNQYLVAMNYHLPYLIVGERIYFVQSGTIEELKQVLVERRLDGHKADRDWMAKGAIV
jgi:hypothetical protein